MIWQCSIWPSTANCADVVALKVADIAPKGYAVERAGIRQQKTGQPVRFELTPQSRRAVDDYVRIADKTPGPFLFSGRGAGRGLSTRKKPFR